MPRMSTASCKAKGRRLQDLVVRLFRERGAKHGLESADIKPAIMGTWGVDVVLSPAAKRVFDLDVECKNVERLSVVPTFREHFNKYRKTSSLKLLVHSKNRMEPLVTMRLEDFLRVLDHGEAALAQPFLKPESKEEPSNDPQG